MVGTVFLFIYWPSFNAILAGGVTKHLAVINTTVSITASTLCALFMSRLLLGTLDFEVLLNSTLAGGVIMGAGCDILASNSCLPIFFGGIAGTISAVGFIKLQPKCKTYFQLHDTCGVQFLHGIPGVLGGLVACIAIIDGGYRFPNKLQAAEVFSFLGERTFQQQAAFNLVGILVTALIAIVSGAMCGWVASYLPMPKAQFMDHVHMHHVKYGDADVVEFNE